MDPQTVVIRLLGLALDRSTAEAICPNGTVSNRISGEILNDPVV